MIRRKATRLSVPAERAYLERTARRTTMAPQQWLCAVTDVGRVRTSNEDAFYLSDDGNVIVVSDGMGGHEKGEVASAIAIRAIADSLAAAKVDSEDPKAIEKLLLGALEDAHQRVLAAGAGDATDQRMGCTILTGLVRSNHLYTCHAGDVRCYLRSGGGFTPMTRDHSVVGALVVGGQLTPDEARVHPQKNEVLQAIGMPHGIVPDINSCELQSGDRVLVCSDGLWEVLSDDEIETVVESDGSMRQLATQLVDRANRAGGTDNITVVLYEHATERASA